VTFEAITRIAGMSDDELGTLNVLLKQLDDKRDRNVLRAELYDGKRAHHQMAAVLPAQYLSLGLVLGWVGKGVDALARRCTLERFTWANGDLDALGAREVMDQNYLRSEVNSAITSALIHSTAFLINVRGEDDEPESLILSQDALNGTGIWNRRRRALDDFVSVTAWKDDRPTEVVLYLDGLTISAAKVDGTWQLTDRSEHPWGVPVEVLPYRPRLGRPFGASRITRPAISSQRAGIREVMRLEGHMDVYSFPELLLLGADGNVFVDESGNTINSWMKMLGRIKGVPDDEDAANPRAQAVQIPASSPEPHLATLNAHAKMCARELGLPDTALAITDVSNPTSAESYDASQYELIAEAQGATDDWSTPLRRSFVRALAIQNGMSEIPPEWLSIDSKWRNPQFLTRAAEADAGAKQLGSVPWLAETEVGLELLGLSDDQIRRALSDRRRLGGSAALRAIADAAAAGRPVVTADASVDGG
jgi:hypothetical protein